MSQSVSYIYQLEQEVKRYKEKAEKYDSLMNANSQVVKDNISLTETYQEIKQLKETIENEIKIARFYQDENINLKQKLEKETTWHDEAEHEIIKLKEIISSDSKTINFLYKKLEKIRDFALRNQLAELEEILKDK